MLNLKLKDWYITNYPEDKLGDRINPEVTFETINENLPRFYRNIGVTDNVMRERVFRQLAKLTNCDYNDLYYRWLGHKY